MIYNACQWWRGRRKRVEGRRRNRVEKVGVEGGGRREERRKEERGRRGEERE